MAQTTTLLTFTLQTTRPQSFDDQGHAVQGADRATALEIMMRVAAPPQRDPLATATGTNKIVMATKDKDRARNF